ncbi:hypothetical protein CDAR_452831 [Caerostris darwini]|uniref:Uncharacterized protein n=1 Tax=Caerostris darwini TaxID=1538125 RepID=A0AAV4SG30_9ARAC|nr:hypothetical protein CDAR_452831 [Caerostris darwini]
MTITVLLEAWGAIKQGRSKQAPPYERIRLQRAQTRKLESSTVMMRNEPTPTRSLAIPAPSREVPMDQKNVDTPERSQDNPGEVELTASYPLQSNQHQARNLFTVTDVSPSSLETFSEFIK